MKQAWIGLTDREFAMIYQLVAAENQSDWLIWQLGWPSWKPLSDFEPEIHYTPPVLSPTIPNPKSGGTR